MEFIIEALINVAAWFFMRDDDEWSAVRIAVSLVAVLVLLSLAYLIFR
jgi:hypothetical protein